MTPSLSESFDLKGRRALVGGASQGIGRATAQALAEMGAQIVALARSREALDELVRGLPGHGHVALACDVGDRARLRSLVSEEIAARGSIDVLVCNAGGPKGGPIAAAEEAQFLAGFEQHVLANSALAQACLPGMRAKRWGRIVNVISTSVKAPIPGLGVSNTIRAAVASWAKTLSQEVGADGITVNNVLPGYTDTPRLHALLDAAAERTRRTKDAVADEWTRSVPAARFADPREVALAIAFLASPAASYVNGINLPVDGGRTPSL